MRYTLDGISAYGLSGLRKEDGRTVYIPVEYTLTFLSVLNAVVRRHLGSHY